VSAILTVFTGKLLQTDGLTVWKQCLRSCNGKAKNVCDRKNFRIYMDMQLFYYIQINCYFI